MDGWSEWLGKCVVNECSGAEVERGRLKVKSGYGGVE